MIASDAADREARERQLDELFSPGCDAYFAGASALFSKVLSEVTQDDCDFVKSVFKRLLREACGRGTSEMSLQALERGADLFHEIGSALSANELIENAPNAIMAAVLRENQRTPEQLCAIAAEGFDMCVQVLAASGTPDGMFRACSKSALGEEPWNPEP